MNRKMRSSSAPSTTLPRLQRHFQYVTFVNPGWRLSRTSFTSAWLRRIFIFTQQRADWAKLGKHAVEWGARDLQRHEHNSLHLSRTPIRASGLSNQSRRILERDQSDRRQSRFRSLQARISTSSSRGKRSMSVNYKQKTTVTTQNSADRPAYTFWFADPHLPDQASDTKLPLSPTDVERIKNLPPRWQRIVAGALERRNGLVRMCTRKSHRSH
jgi:hypothetical protein